MTPDEIFDRLDEFVFEDRVEEVEREALRAARGKAEDVARDLWAYVAWARFELGDLRGAVTAARKAHDPLLLAKARFHLWEFEEANAALERFAQSGGDRDENAEAAFYRGLLAEFSGRDGDRFYTRAARLAPDLFAEPVRMSDDEVESVLRATLRGLPPEIRAFADETVVFVRPLPKPHPDVDPLTLGLYVGRDLLNRSPEASGELPPHIEIFKGNLERRARDRDELVAELRTTLLHELGHHLGFDERGVAELGLE